MAPLATVNRSDNRTFLVVRVFGAKLAYNLGIDGRMICRCQEPGIIKPRVIAVFQPAKATLHGLAHFAGLLGQKAKLSAGCLGGASHIVCVRWYDHDDVLDASFD